MRIPPLVIGEYRGARGRDLAAPRRERPSRRRLVLQSLVIVALAAGLGLGMYWLLTSPVFAVSRIQTGRYRYSERAAVEAALSRCLGRNIWTLSRHDVAAACRALPWVSAVYVRRRIPDTVTVELTEWRPLLGVADPLTGESDKVLAADGRILQVPPHLTVPALPLLVDCRLATYGVGRWQLADQDPGRVLALVAALETTGVESACPVDFVRWTDRGFEIILQGGAGSLVLGTEDFPARLARFLLARDRLPVGAAVDLRFADRITFEPPPPEQS